MMLENCMVSEIALKKVLSGNSMTIRLSDKALRKLA